MGAKKMPPIPPEIERLQRDYAIQLDHVLAGYVRVSKRVQNDPEGLRRVRLRADCLRYEYLMLFRDPAKAHEAWEKKYHPIYAHLRGYR